MSQTDATRDFPGMHRKAFIQRVRSALGKGRSRVPDQSAPVVDESIARLANQDDDLLVLFSQRAADVGMAVWQIKQIELAEKIKSVLFDHQARRVVVAMTDSQAMRQALMLDGIEVVDDSVAGDILKQFSVDAGITDVQGAIAESGTVVCHSGAGYSRGPSLVPALHIPIVRRSDIVPDMIDYWRTLKDTPLPSSMALITGPSKTADIESVLVTGVHGPKVVHIMLVEDA